MTNKLTELDKWTIARVLAGYTMPELPAGMSKRAHALSSELLHLHFRDRDSHTRRNLSAAEVTAIIALDTESAQPRVQQPPRAPYQIIDVKDLDKLPPLTWLIPSMILDAGFCILFGESGAGKSFVAIDFSLQVAQTKRVVYIPTEGVGGYKKRIAAWCQHNHKQPGDLKMVIGTVNLFDSKAYQPLLDDLRDLKPAMVVIDTLAMAMAGADENSARDMGIVIGTCRQLTYDTGAAVLLVHHVGKAGVSERGSGALRGNADVMIRISPADDLVMVECSKTKDEGPFEPMYLSMLPVQLPDGAESRVLVPAAMKEMGVGDTLTPNQRRILDWLQLETNVDGMTMRELAEVGGISLGTVQRAASNLIKAGLLVNEKGKGYQITDAGRKRLESVESQLESQPVFKISPHESVESVESPESRESTLGNKTARVIQPIQPIQPIHTGKSDPRDPRDSLFGSDRVTTQYDYELGNG